jgi:hypothetical protein
MRGIDSAVQVLLLLLLLLQLQLLLMLMRHSAGSSMRCCTAPCSTMHS